MENSNKFVLEFENTLLSEETVYDNKNSAVLGFIKIVLNYKPQFDNIMYEAIVSGALWKMTATLNEFNLELGEKSYPIMAKIYTKEQKCPK